jgi:multicomponent Na+:H+ antiporter subunit E
MTGSFLVNILLAIAWALITGSFTVLNLLFGFVLASGALWLIREQYGTVSYLSRAWRWVKLMLRFLYELVLSSVRVARLVLSPRMDIRPGIIAFPLTVERDVEITTLANLITLTPGTLSLDVSDNRKTLYIHAIDVPDADAIRREIETGFERMVMEAYR